MNKSRPRGRPLDPQAGYRRVLNELRTRLENERWEHGAVFPSLNTLAAEFGVSRITIRRAISVLRSEGYLELGPGRRIVVVSRLGVRSATHQLVVLVVNCYLDAFLRTSAGMQIYQGLSLGITDQGRSLLVAHNFRFRDAIPGSFETLPVSGLLLWGHFEPPVLRLYEKMNVPLVVVDQPRGELKMHAACVDNEAAAFEATKRLLALGHRRIAFLRQLLPLSHKVDPDSLERQRGYERAFRAQGLRPDRSLVFNIFSSDTAESPAMRSLMSEQQRVTAVLCVDEYKAELVREAAHARGLKIPRDLSIVCFQEKRPGLSPFSGPRTDFMKLGLQAAELLKQPKAPSVERRVPPEWGEGTTVSAVRK